MAVEVPIQHLLATSHSHRKCHLVQDYPYLVDMKLYFNKFNMRGKGKVTEKAGQVQVEKKKKNRDQRFVSNVSF